ncbi:hypothetical protein V2A60_009742 [Cordyceps javanica]
MSSLARARSLRRPAGPTALPPRERPGEAIQDPNRNVSPSRLPTKPPTASRPTRSATTTTTTTPARSASGRLNRPGSASSNASSAATSTVVPKRSVSLGKRTTTGTATQGGHTTTAPPARKDAQRYPPLSSATRPASMIVRPTSAGSTASASASTLARRTTPTHARANSAAMTATTPASTTARGAAHRPPTATAPTQQERKSRSRPPSRDQASSASSGIVAAAAAATPGTPKRRAESADKQQPPTTSPAAAAGRTPRLQHRPAFNSLQQRLSPAKTCSPRAAATPPRATSPSKLPANVAAAAETARLQGTLLQLHLLHRDAGAAERQWHASAKAKLGTRFRALRDAHRTLVDREAAAAEADNAAALRRWASGDTQPLDAKVRALDAALSGVWAMSEPGGKYARAVRRFERWVERVMDLEEARDSGTIGLWASGRSSGGGGGGGEEALFVPELEPAWAVECAGMALKLEGWQDQLDGAASPHDDPDETDGPTTGLGRMLDGARSLVADMLAELTAMEEIRQAAVTREENWIESMNRDDDDDESDAPPRAGAVWRAL